MFFRSMKLSLIAATLGVAAAGCSARQPPVETPLPTPVLMSAPVTLSTSPIIEVSPRLGVSDELAKACALRLGDPGLSPEFPFDKSALAPADTDFLSQVAACFNGGPLSGRLLDLVGHTDDQGESEYNVDLGARRASSVGEALEELGLSSGQIFQSSRGKLDAIGTTPETRRRDRRVDLLLRP